MSAFCAFCGAKINKGDFAKLDGDTGHKSCVQKRLARRERMQLNMNLINNTPGMVTHSLAAISIASQRRKSMHTNFET